MLSKLAAKLQESLGFSLFFLSKQGATKAERVEGKGGGWEGFLEEMFSAEMSQ